LVGLRDLKGDKQWVRDRIVDYLNQLIDWGVAGFRVDAAKHMWPRDLNDILNTVHHLNTTWFPVNTRPFVYQEVRNTPPCPSILEYFSPGPKNLENPTAHDYYEEEEVCVWVFWGRS